MRTRAERRHHHQRMVDKVSRFDWIKPEFYHGDEKQRQKHIRKLAETRHPMDCYCCCNPRRNVWLKKERLTIQERRMEEYNLE